MFDIKEEMMESDLVKVVFIGSASEFSKFLLKEKENLILEGDPSEKSSWYGSDVGFVVADGKFSEDLSKFKTAIEAAKSAGLTVCAVLIADEPIDVSAPLLLMKPVDYASNEEIGEEIYGAVRAVTDIVSSPGLISLDLADVRGLLEGKEKCFFAMSTSFGDNAACTAAEQVVNHLSAKHKEARRAKSILLYVAGSENNISMFEVSEASVVISDWVENDKVNIIWGAGVDESLGEQVKVFVLLVD